jgi:hypothetical protein
VTPGNSFPSEKIAFSVVYQQMTGRCLRVLPGHNSAANKQILIAIAVDIGGTRTGAGLRKYR